MKSIFDMTEEELNTFVLTKSLGNLVIHPPLGQHKIFFMLNMSGASFRLGNNLLDTEIECLKNLLDHEIKYRNSLVEKEIYKEIYNEFVEEPESSVNTLKDKTEKDTQSYIELEEFIKIVLSSKEFNERYSCKDGPVEASYEIGRLYDVESYDGKVIKPGLVSNQYLTAKYWYERASENDHIGALMALGRLYESGKLNSCKKCLSSPMTVSTDIDLIDEKFIILTGEPTSLDKIKALDCFKRVLQLDSSHEEAINKLKAHTPFFGWSISDSIRVEKLESSTLKELGTPDLFLHGESLTDMIQKINKRLDDLENQR